MKWKQRSNSVDAEQRGFGFGGKKWVHFDENYYNEITNDTHNIGRNSGVHRLRRGDGSGEGTFEERGRENTMPSSSNMENEKCEEHYLVSTDDNATDVYQEYAGPDSSLIEHSSGNIEATDENSYDFNDVDSEFTPCLSDSNELSGKRTSPLERYLVASTEQRDDNEIISSLETTKKRQMHKFFGNKSFAEKNKGGSNDNRSQQEDHDGDDRLNTGKKRELADESDIRLHDNLERKEKRYFRGFMGKRVTGRTNRGKDLNGSKSFDEHTDHRSVEVDREESDSPSLTVHEDKQENEKHRDQVVENKGDLRTLVEDITPKQSGIADSNSREEFVNCGHNKFLAPSNNHTSEKVGREFLPKRSLCDESSSSGSEFRTEETSTKTSPVDGGVEVCLRQNDGKTTEPQSNSGNSAQKDTQKDRSSGEEQPKYKVLGDKRYLTTEFKRGTKLSPTIHRKQRMKQVQLTQGLGGPRTTERITTPFTCGNARRVEGKRYMEKGKQRTLKLQQVSHGSESYVKEPKGRSQQNIPTVEGTATNKYPAAENDAMAKDSITHDEPLDESIDVFALGRDKLMITWRSAAENVSSAAIVQMASSAVEKPDNTSIETVEHEEDWPEEEKQRSHKSTKKNKAMMLFSCKACLLRRKKTNVALAEIESSQDSPLDGKVKTPEVLRTIASAVEESSDVEDNIPFCLTNDLMSFHKSEDSAGASIKKDMNDSSWGGCHMGATTLGALGIGAIGAAAFGIQNGRCCDISKEDVPVQSREAESCSSPSRLDGDPTAEDKSPRGDSLTRDGTNAEDEQSHENWSNPSNDTVDPSSQHCRLGSSALGTNILWPAAWGTSRKNWCGNIVHENRSAQYVQSQYIVDSVTDSTVEENATAEGSSTANDDETHRVSCKSGDIASVGSNGPCLRNCPFGSFSLGALGVGTLGVVAMGAGRVKTDKDDTSAATTRGESSCSSLPGCPCGTHVSTRGETGRSDMDSVEGTGNGMFDIQRVGDAGKEVSAAQDKAGRLVVMSQVSYHGSSDQDVGAGGAPKKPGGARLNSLLRKHFFVRHRKMNMKGLRRRRNNRVNVAPD